jgi:Fic family protein
MRYIYQQNNWHKFVWKESEIQVLLSEVRLLQGNIRGIMQTLGFSQKNEASLETLAINIIKSSEIEGETLNYGQVRSSIARRLGMEKDSAKASSRSVEGIVDMALDAVQNSNLPLSEKRLLGWHAALFPTGWSGLCKIKVGMYRTEEMQIVSGVIGSEKVYYEAPKPQVVKAEMDNFFKWFNGSEKMDAILKAAIAHFWFVIIHPFDDGNGRIARAISDLMLARSDGSIQRFYSMSAQILKERKKYYFALQKCQHGTSDITFWLKWFLECLLNALHETEKITALVLQKANFWDRHKNTKINDRQRIMLNKLLDGFKGKLNTTKWAKIAKCSHDTALRDIKDLIEKSILKQEESDGKGKKVFYTL